MFVRLKTRARYLIDNLFAPNVTGMDKDVAKTYGNRVRVRACGICWKHERLLMVNHRGVSDADFWAPPGGGVEFGQSISATLRRELLEETGLVVVTGDFLFGCEFIREPLHSVELFYSVTVESGSLKTGTDPEIEIISDVRFLSFDEILKIPAAELHGIFHGLNSPADLKRLQGFFRI